MACYLPGTGTLAAIGIFVYLIWHKVISEILHILGLVLETAVICATGTMAVGIVIWTARAIQRRRARAGACLNCRLRCQQSLDAGLPGAAITVRGRPVLVTLVPSRPLAGGVTGGEPSATGTPDPVVIPDPAAARDLSSSSRSG